jgi:hypothetical protein
MKVGVGIEFWLLFRSVDITQFSVVVAAPQSLFYAMKARITEMTPPCL